MDRTMDGHVLVQMLLTHHFLIRQIASFHFASQKLHSNSHPFPHFAAAGGIALSLQAENKKRSRGCILIQSGTELRQHKFRGTTRVASRH